MKKLSMKTVANLTVSEAFENLIKKCIIRNLSPKTLKLIKCTIMPLNVWSGEMLRLRRLPIFSLL